MVFGVVRMMFACPLPIDSAHGQGSASQSNQCANLDENFHSAMKLNEFVHRAAWIGEKKIQILLALPCGAGLLQRCTSIPHSTFLVD